MLLISRHLMQYGIVPLDAVIRINLAWEQSLRQLSQHLMDINHDVFLDVPCGRKKPPHNTYDKQDVADVVRNHQKIRYVAISQVEQKEDIQWWLENLPPYVSVVPKIESTTGCKNILLITQDIAKPIIMLDHDDLFQDLCSLGQAEELYTSWVNPLIDTCKKHHIEILRTVGVVFVTED